MVLSADISQLCSFSQKPCRVPLTSVMQVKHIVKIVKGPAHTKMSVCVNSDSPTTELSPLKALSGLLWDSNHCRGFSIKDKPLCLNGDVSNIPVASS